MITVKNLTKRFGPKLAVDDLSFSVEKGSVLGFLGPNGAGKSTSMRMVTGYLPPTMGSITIGGDDVVANPIAAKARVGYLPENAPLYTDMTVESFLKFSGELRGLSGAKLKAGVERAIELCFLGPVRKQIVDTLSKGYKHRTCLAQSVLHDPEVLILDEPTDGLDPNQKHEVRSLIKRMGEEKAIIFSTHILEEVEAACTRAVIIDRGRIVADGTPHDLKRRASRSGAVHVSIEGLTGSGIRAELEKLAGAASVQEESASDNAFAGTVMPKNSSRNDGQLAAEIFKFCSEKNLVLKDLHEDKGRLDEMFREVTIQDKS